MIQRLIKDESGVALGLAVIVIVLIGVMGAGLLTFVRNDLEAVVEVNQGQKAFEIADAGVQAAKRQLLSDSTREHYDLRYQNDCVLGQRLGEDWSPTTTGYPNADCTGTPVTKAAGVTKNFAGGSFTVIIQCLDQTGDSDDDGSGYDPATDDPNDVCAPGANNPSNDDDDGDDGDDDGVDDDDAPEAVPASSKAFFKVTSTGCYPADCSGAKRRVEAIYNTNRLDVPTAYYTPKSMTIQGNVNLSGVSFFAKENINLVGGSITIDRATPALYKDWDTTNPANFNPTSKLNTVPRTDALGNRMVGVGLAAEGLICKNGNCSDSAVNSVADGINDYDKYTGTKGSNKQFVRKADPNVDNATGAISYPFNPDAQFDLDLLMEEAQRQGNYQSSPVDITNTNYPTTSNDRTVFFVEGGGSTTFLKYSVNRTPIAQGTIIVRNGNLTINNSSNGFKGVIIITGDGTNTGKYDSGGNDSVQGFVIASGNMDIRGSVSPFVVTEDFTNRPGFYSVNLWSWRELYE